MEKKEIESGRIEIDYVRNNNETDGKMEVWGMTKPEVIKCLTDILVKLLEQTLESNKNK